MIRTYKFSDTIDKEYVIHGFSDCNYYTICDNETEYKKEIDRIKQIDIEYNQAIDDYINSLID